MLTARQKGMKRSNGRRYLHLKAAGLCVACAANETQGTVLCEPCAVKYRTRSAAAKRRARLERKQRICT